MFTFFCFSACELNQRAMKKMGLKVEGRKLQKDMLRSYNMILGRGILPRTPHFYDNEEGALKTSYFCTFLHLEMHIMSHALRKHHPETHYSKSHVEMALGGLYMLLLIERSQDEHYGIFSVHKNGCFYSVPTEETSILQIILSHWFCSS